MFSRPIIRIRKIGGDQPYWLTLHLGGITFSADYREALEFGREQDAALFVAELMNNDPSLQVNTEYE